MNQGDLLNIGVFSELTGITRSTLIYYDDIGVFSPSARGENNYRYYMPEQIITVNLVSVLRDIGVPLKDVVRLASCRSPGVVAELFSSKEKQLEEQIDKLRGAQKVMSTFRKLIAKGFAADVDRVSLEELEDMPISLGQENKFAEDGVYYDSFISYCKEARDRNVSLSFPIGGMFDDIESFVRSPSNPGRFFSLTPDGNDIRPAGLYLVAYTRGDYGVTNGIADRMIEYAKSRGIEFAGPVFNVFLFDEISQTESKNYLMEAAAAVVRR